jgi:hypothetical protein
VPYKAEKEFAFPRFDILMVCSLKAYSTLDVSFIHDYSSFVAMGMSREITGIGPVIIKVMFKTIIAMLKVLINEVKKS